MNPVDPFHGRAELGFNAERFREIAEEHAKEAQEETAALSAAAEGDRTVG